MKTIIFILLFWGVGAQATNSPPKNLADMYCLNHGFEASKCRHASLEDVLLMKLEYSYDEAQTITGEDLCKKAAHTPTECEGANRSFGICLNMSRTIEDCKDVTAATLICVQTGKSWQECDKVTEAQALCAVFDSTLDECASFNEVEVLCLNKRRDRKFCKGVSRSQLKCVYEGKTKEQLSDCK